MLQSDEKCHSEELLLTRTIYSRDSDIY